GAHAIVNGITDGSGHGLVQPVQSVCFADGVPEGDEGELSRLVHVGAVPGPERGLQWLDVVARQASECFVVASLGGGERVAEFGLRKCGAGAVCENLGNVHFWFCFLYLYLWRTVLPGRIFYYRPGGPCGGGPLGGVSGRVAS